jgi:hypothetical protein
LQIPGCVRAPLGASARSSRQVVPVLALSRMPGQASLTEVLSSGLRSGAKLQAEAVLPQAPFRISDRTRTGHGLRARPSAPESESGESSAVNGQGSTRLPSLNDGSLALATAGRRRFIVGYNRVTGSTSRYYVRSLVDRSLGADEQG